MSFSLSPSMYLSLSIGFQYFDTHDTHGGSPRDGGGSGLAAGSRDGRLGPGISRRLRAFPVALRTVAQSD